MNQFSLPKNMNRFSLPKNMPNPMDPCSMGPLTCGVDPRDVRQNDDSSNLNNLFSMAAQKGRASLNSAFRSASTTGNTTQHQAQQPHKSGLLESTMERIHDYQSRGWLSQQETRQYMARLESVPIEKGNRQRFEEFIRSDLIRELDQLEEKMNGVSRSTATASAPRSTTKVFSKQPIRPLGDATTRKLNKSSKSDVILTAEQVAKQIGQGQIEELFVETCFFARLGFVQPPSCLRCSYRESIKNDTTTAKCNRWVVWRRDANHIIHPKYLSDNTVFVQCHAARLLTAGQSVDGHQWDASQKIMLFPR